MQAKSHFTFALIVETSVIVQNKGKIPSEERKKKDKNIVVASPSVCEEKSGGLVNS